MRDRLRIATRESALALWQAQAVATALRQAHRGLEVELVPMTTRGDQILDRPLADIGGKGLFLKALEVAMLEGAAELAVHSMKDVPAQLDPEFILISVLPRHDPSDALVCNKYRSIVELPAGACVASSSLRRQIQLKQLRPDLQAVDVRGNVNTRLAKLDAEQFDAMILACAGLERLGIGQRVAARLGAPHWLPAVGQGALAVEYVGANQDLAQLLAPLIDGPTQIAITAERAMNRVLEGSCEVPIAAWASIDGARLTLHGAVGDMRAGKMLTAVAQGTTSAPDELGARVGAALLAQGARAVLGQRT